jgi:DNA-binding XRE family transcriptional regulator
MPLTLNNHRIHVFHEGRKRRIFVGELGYLQQSDQYEFIYDKGYTLLKAAIAVGPELSLFKLRHLSVKSKLFPTFLDRIPSRDNPAYGDYCNALNIPLDEKNPIILLGSIGRRGPSSFVFEPIYETSAMTGHQIVEFRKSLGMTQHDFAAAFDFSNITINRMENGLSKDSATLNRIKIYQEFPVVALWQLKQTGSRIHFNVLLRAQEFLLRKQTLR